MSLRRSHPLGLPPLSLLPAGKVLSRVFRGKFRGGVTTSLLAQETPLPRSYYRTGGAETICILSPHYFSARLGGLCQTLFRWTDSSAPLSRPLQASGCDQQSSAVGVRWRA